MEAVDVHLGARGPDFFPPMLLVLHLGLEDLVLRVDIAGLRRILLHEPRHLGEVLLPALLALVDLRLGLLGMVSLVLGKHGSLSSKLVAIKAPARQALGDSCADVARFASWELLEKSN